LFWWQLNPIITTTYQVFKPIKKSILIGNFLFFILETHGQFPLIKRKWNTDQEDTIQKWKSRKGLPRWVSATKAEPWIVLDLSETYCEVVANPYDRCLKGPWSIQASLKSRCLTLQIQSFGTSQGWHPGSTNQITLEYLEHLIHNYRSNLTIFWMYQLGYGQYANWGSNTKKKCLEPNPNKLSFKLACFLYLKLSWNYRVIVATIKLWSFIVMKLWTICVFLHKHVEQYPKRVSIRKKGWFHAK